MRAALGPDAELEGRHTAWPIPAGIDRATLAEGRTLFVGDAAMATDVMTGEGIGQALLTGRLAAEAIIAAGALDPAGAARRYTDDVRHHLVADHRMSVALGRVLAHERGARGAVGLLARSGGWGRRNFARWMFEDEPRGRRRHPVALAPPGAVPPRPVRHRLTAPAPDPHRAAGMRRRRTRPVLIRRAGRRPARGTCPCRRRRAARRRT